MLRAVAGGTAVDVALSRSFLVVTSACALFLVVGKRHAELVGPGRLRPSRATLRRYSRRGLRLLLAGTAMLGFVAYAGWSFSRPALGPWLPEVAVTIRSVSLVAQTQVGRTWQWRLVADLPFAGQPAGP